MELPGVAGLRCLVTGGLGFIGSNLAIELAGAGADVTVVDSLVPRHGGDTRNLEGAAIELVVADIADPATEPLIGRADLVFNLAGQVSHVDSMTDPLTDLDLNARSQLAFLEKVRRVNPTARVVYTSTRQVYGRPEYLPVDEQHPVRPIDVNGVSKYAAERLHLIYAEAHSMQTTALRLTNVYGPRQRLAGDHQGFLPVFIRTALDGGTITLYGDGSQERDCLYVDDVVVAIVAAAVNPSAVGEVFNLGADPLSLRVIADTITDVAGSGSVVMAPWPPERARIDIGSYQGDYTKAATVLGWKPLTTFRDGVEKTITYYRGGQDRYR